MSEFIVKHASEHVVAKAKIEREYAAAETAVNDEIAKYASVSRSTFEKAKADLYQRWDPGFEQLNANLLKSESARMAHLVTSRGQNEALSPEGAAISAQLEERVKTFGVDQNLTRAAAWARLRQIDADFAALDDRSLGRR